LNPYRLKKHLT